jgi:hypothetical protein
LCTQRMAVSSGISHSFATGIRASASSGFSFKIACEHELFKLGIPVSARTSARASVSVDAAAVAVAVADAVAFVRRKM